MREAERPLPTKSSIHNQKNCKTSTSRVRKKTATKGPTKALMMSLSSFLNIYDNSARGSKSIIIFVQRTPLENDEPKNKNTAFAF